MFLLFQELYQIPGVIIAIIGILTFIAGIIATYVFLRSGISDKQADGYKRLYELEAARSKHFETVNTGLVEELKTKDAQNATLSNEFTAISQLYAKKSILYEIETGDIERAIKHFELSRLGIHTEETNGLFNSPHKTESPESKGEKK